MNDSAPAFMDMLGERLGRCRERVQVLQRRRHQIDEAIEREEEVIRHIEALVEAEREAYRAGEAGQPLPLPVEQAPSFAGMRIRAAVIKLLIEKGRAMHADEIRAELEHRGMKFSDRDAKASVVTALVRGRRKGFFERIRPNTYRLAKLPQDEVDGVAS
jgi:hypothetical protein